MKKLLFVPLLFAAVIFLAGCLAADVEITTHYDTLTTVGEAVYDYFDDSGNGSIFYVDPITGLYERAGEDNSVPIYAFNGDEYVAAGIMFVEKIGYPYEEISFKYQLLTGYDWTEPFETTVSILVGVVNDNKVLEKTGKFEVTVDYTPDCFIDDISLSVAAGPEESFNTDTEIFVTELNLSSLPTDVIESYGIFVDGTFIGNLKPQGTTESLVLYSDHTEVGILEISYEMSESLAGTDTVVFTLTAADSVVSRYETDGIVEIGGFTEKNGVITKTGTLYAFNVECEIGTGAVILESIAGNTAKLEGVTALYYLAEDGKWTILNSTAKVPVYSASDIFIGNITGKDGTVIFNGEGDETVTDSSGKKVYASSGTGIILLRSGKVSGGTFSEVTGIYTVTCVNSDPAKTGYGPLSAWAGESADFYYSLDRSDIEIKGSVTKEYSFKYRTQEYDVAASQTYWSEWKTVAAEDAVPVKRIYTEGGKTAVATIGDLTHGIKVEGSKVKFTYTAEGTGSSCVGTGKVQIALVYGEGTSESSEQFVVDVFEISCQNKGAESV